MKTLILILAPLAAASATIIPVDVGPPRMMQGDIFVNVPALGGTPLAGQTLSVDYQFGNLLHFFTSTSKGFYFAVRAETNMAPQADALYPSVISSAYAVGPNGYVGPTLDLGGNTMLFGPNVTEILFGLCYAGDQRGLYLTGLHFDLTLPDIPSAEITGLRMHIDPNGNFFGVSDKWQIVSSIPETGDAAALLGLGILAMLGLRHWARCL